MYLPSLTFWTIKSLLERIGSSILILNRFDSQILTLDELLLLFPLLNASYIDTVSYKLALFGLFVFSSIITFSWLIFKFSILTIGKLFSIWIIGRWSKEVGLSKFFFLTSFNCKSAINGIRQIGQLVDWTRRFIAHSLLNKTNKLLIRSF